MFEEYCRLPFWFEWPSGCSRPWLNPEISRRRLGYKFDVFSAGIIAGLVSLYET
jgi:hypothetical protein